MPNEELGRLIRSYRNRLGWSLDKTSQVCKVARTQLNLIETARSDQTPKVETIEKLIKGLELELHEANQVRTAAAIKTDDASYGYQIRVDEATKALVDTYLALEPDMAMELERSAQSLLNIQQRRMPR